jgi:hypothetical protein
MLIPPDPILIPASSQRKPNMPQSKSKPVVVKLPDGTRQSSNLSAYVVNGEGKVVESVPFKEMEALLDTSGETLKGSRLFVGPEFPAEYPKSKIDAFALAQARAYQVSTSANKDNAILLRRIPSQVVTGPLPIYFCDVQGNVTNTLTINGVPQSGPVCKAKVHICTVEWFFRWPIWLRPVVPVAIVDSLQSSIVNLRTQPVPTATRTAQDRRSVQTLPPLPADVENQLLTATPDTIHEIVFNNAAILFPYFCWWPLFWPWFYRVVEQEVVFTDCNGHFDGWLVNIGTNILENVYIWVEANIGGNWVTVYKPPFPCHTNWNYTCGTAIDISLSNPAIPPCNCDAQVVDGTVWFTAIGGYAIASSIQQDVNSIYAPTGIHNVGCTNLFDSHQLSPFGGTLNLNLAFGPTLPTNATHYRWSWSYILDSSMNPITPAPTEITGAVNRYYIWPKPNGSWESNSIALKDTDTNGEVAYLIPQYDVTAYPLVSPEAEWVSFNFVSASLDSTKLSNGYVIRLDLELLNNNAGVFEVASVPVKTFQISVDTNAAAAYDGSVPAPSNYLTPDPAISGNALKFSLLVRVDNSAVTALINPAGIEGGGPAGPCGMIQFANLQQNIDLSFVASEPFNFATFSYGLVMGTSGTVASASGYVSEVTSLLGLPSLNLSGGAFSGDMTVASLLGTNCPSAAFAETLSVASLATDGSVLLSGTGGPYYAFTSAAFALTPSG